MRRRDLAWLAAVVIACAVSISVDLGARDSVHTMEYVAIATSQETWLGWHDGMDEPWFAAFSDGEPRVRKPPLITWLNALAWIDLDPASTPPQTLVARARIVSVGMGLLTLVGVFWAGCTLLGSRGALLAVLVAGSTMFLQRQARTASYDIHVTCWVTLAVASALWAMRPFGPAPALRRRLIGWLGCAAGMTLAAYTKNPLPVVFVVVAVGGAIAVRPGRGVAGATARRSGGRGADAAWLIGMCVLAIAAVAPWYVLMFRAFPGSFETVSSEFQPARPGDAQVPYYYIGVLGLVLPWTIWLVAGLVHPFMGYVRPGRRRRLVAWIWFVAIVVIMSVPDAKQQRYILPVLPAAALLIAAVWTDHQALADRGARDLGIRPFIWIHWALLIAASIGVGLVGLGFAGDHREAIGDIGALPTLIATAVLLGLAVLGLRRHVAWRPYRAAVICGAWGLVALGVFWHANAGGTRSVSPTGERSRALRAQLEDAPIRVLRIRAGADRRRRLDEDFRIYYGRRIPPVRPEDLEAYVEAAGDVAYVLAADEPGDSMILSAAGFSAIQPVRTEQEMRLWRGDAPAR